MFGWSQEEKDRALRKAVCSDDLYATRKLLDKGANPNALGDDGYTIMQRAVGRGNLAVIRLLVSDGGKLVGPQTEDDRRTLLHIAADADVVDYLFKNGAGADLAALDRLGNSPIETIVADYNWRHVFTDESKRKVFDAFFAQAEKYGAANPLLTGSRGARQALLTAALQVNADDAVIKKIVDASKDILNLVTDQMSGDDLLPLQVAAAAGNIDAIKIMIAAGADVNAVNDQKRNAAHHVKDTATLACLISAGVNIEQVDNRGRTPVMAAIESRDEAVVAELIARGANLKRCDAKGIPYVCLAVESGKNIFTMMLQHEADIGVACHDGRSVVEFMSGVSRSYDPDMPYKVMFDVLQKRQAGGSANAVATEVPEMPVAATQAESSAYCKLSDTSILVQNGGGFASMFNFASGQVTEMKDGVPYLTQNFNALGRRELVDEVRQKLIDMHGKPPVSKTVMNGLVIKE